MKKVHDKGWTFYVGPELEFFYFENEKAAAVLDIPIGRCMVLEDSSTGIEAASKAGALPVMVSSALPVDKTTILRCQLVFNDLLELLDFIQG